MTVTDKTISNDWATSGSKSFVGWGIPIVIMVVSRFYGEASTAIAWPLALGWLGGASFLNAARCGRVHCVFTGPFYLAMAAIALLFSFGILEVNDRTWSALAGITVLGAATILFGSEAFFGKYVQWRK